MTKKNLFGTHKGFNSPFSFFLFGKKQKYNNNNNKWWQSNREVSSSCYVLLFSHSSFCQHTQVPHSYLVMDVLFCVAFLQHYHYYYDRTLSWRSFLQETESTPWNFLMYCLEGTVFSYTHESRGILLCLLSRASFFLKNILMQPKWLSIHRKI